MSAILPEHKKEILIELVREQPMLYDRNSKLHRRSEIRDKIWFEIARVLEADKNVCKQAWKSMRDQYVKSLRLLNKRRYKYFDSMTFLNDYGTLKILRENPNLKTTASNFSQNNEDFWIDFDTIDSSHLGDLNKEVTFDSLKQDASSINEDDTNEDNNAKNNNSIDQLMHGDNISEIECLNSLDHNIIPIEMESCVDKLKEDRYDQFFLSLASTVRDYNITLNKWAELQCKVIKCVTNELEKTGKK